MNNFAAFNAREVEEAAPEEREREREEYFSAEEQ